MTTLASKLEHQLERWAIEKRPASQQHIHAEHNLNRRSIRQFHYHYVRTNEPRQLGLASVEDQNRYLEQPHRYGSADAAGRPASVGGSTELLQNRGGDGRDVATGVDQCLSFDRFGYREARGTSAEQRRAVEVDADVNARFIRRNWKGQLRHRRA
jgi:hypothetical protein